MYIHTYIGVLFSTSHFFEKQLNWTAIHIEADLVNAEQLRKLRGQAINIQAALCDSERVLHYVIANNANKIKEGAGMHIHTCIHTYIQTLRTYIHI